MKLILILLLFPVILHAQEIGPGLWVQATLSYEDGTSDAAPATSTEQFVKYRFLPNNRVQISNGTLFFISETNYSVKDSILLLGGLTYRIESLTEHVVVISPGGSKSKRLPGTSFLRPENLITSDKPEFNPAIQDSVYASNRYLFPDCDMTQQEIGDKIGYLSGSGKFEISFIVTKLGKLVNFNIEGYSDKDKKHAAAIAKVFQRSSMKWLPARTGGRNVNASVKMTLFYDNVSVGVNGWTNSFAVQMLF